jgi:hypothetical protein
MLHKLLAYSQFDLVTLSYDAAQGQAGYHIYCFTVAAQKQMMH